MHIEFDRNDLEKIATIVVERLKPMLKDNNRATKGDKIFDVKGLAEYLGVNRSWVDKKVSQKEIPYFKCGKYTRFKKSAIERWIDKESINPIPPLKIVNNRR